MFWSLRSPLNAQHHFLKAAKMPQTDHTIAEHQMIGGKSWQLFGEHSGALRS